MAQLPPRPGSAYPEVLLMLHHASLLPNWVVRRAAPDDMPGVHTLLGGLPDGETLQQAFISAMGA